MSESDVLEPDVIVATPREEVFTTAEGLVGILTHPSTEVPAAPAVLLLNSGNMHRVGTGRISVTLARSLAEAGHLVVRFDHAGVGDSAPRRDGLAVDTARVVEILEVVSELAARYGVERFVLYGLCSGARDAYRAALEDPRIVGLVQIDGFAYRNLHFHVRRLLGRDFGSVMRGLGRKIGLVRAGERSSPGEDMWIQEWSDYPPRSEIEDGYRRLVQRGVHLFVVFTGSWVEEYNYERQFFDMYSGVDFGDRLTLRYMPEAEHTLPDPDDRAGVVDDVGRWMKRTFTSAEQPVS